MKTKELKIKVCGMRYPENLEQLCALEPDFVGFIFYPGSPRFVGNFPDQALFEIPPAGCIKIGVFVNEELSRVREAVKKYKLDGVQLHGGESLEYCSSLAGELMLLKALDPSGIPSGIKSYSREADYLLFDTPDAAYGGTGRKFDWTRLHDIPASIPFLLSGGIAPGDAAVIRDLKHKGLKGVDLNSRFERSPGRKDMEQLKEFFKEIRK